MELLFDEPKIRRLQYCTVVEARRVMADEKKFMSIQSLEALIIN